MRLFSTEDIDFATLHFELPTTFMTLNIVVGRNDHFFHILQRARKMRNEILQTGVHALKGVVSRFLQTDCCECTIL